MTIEDYKKIKLDNSIGNDKENNEIKSDSQVVDVEARKTRRKPKLPSREGKNTEK